MCLKTPMIDSLVFFTKILFQGLVYGECGRVELGFKENFQKRFFIGRFGHIQVNQLLEGAHTDAGKRHRKSPCDT